MGLLKSVISDARPTKSVPQVHSSPSGVSVPLPAAGASDNMPVKSSGKPIDTFPGQRTRHDPRGSNVSVQDSYRLSHLSGNKRDQHSSQTKRFSQPEKSYSHTPQVKDVKRQLTRNQNDESAQPIAKVTTVKQSKDVPASKSVLFGTNSVPIEDHLPSDPTRGLVTEKISGDRGRKNIRDKNVKSPANIPTLIQRHVGKPGSDPGVSDSADFSKTDSTQVLSVSNKSQEKAQQSDDRGFFEVGLNPGRLEIKGPNPQQKRPSRDHKSDISVHNEKPDVTTALYVDGDYNNAHDRDRNPDVQSVEKIESEKPATDTGPSEVVAQLDNLQLQERRQQTDKQAGMQVMAAKTTNMPADQLASQQADLTPAINSAHSNLNSSEVRIGQVDVFIDKPVPATATAGRSFRPSISMASRHYLRRL